MHTDDIPHEYPHRYCGYDAWVLSILMGIAYPHGHCK